MTPPTIPRFELLKCIGSSDGSETWLAKSRTGKLEALEFCPMHALGVEDVRRVRAFERWTRHHPKFVAVHRMVEHEGCYFRAMELADDHRASPRTSIEEYVPHTVHEHLRRGLTYELDACVQIVRAALDALAHLHEHDLVHGDVKPARLVFIDGRSKLAHPGLVALSTGRSNRIATSYYGPSESVLDPSGDLYSLGRILHEMLTGIGPDRFPELPEHLEGAQLEAYRRLAPLIDRACAPGEQARFHTAREFRAALHDRVAGLDISDVREDPATLDFTARIWPWTKRSTWLIVGLVSGWAGWIARVWAGARIGGDA